MVYFYKFGCSRWGVIVGLLLLPLSLYAQQQQEGRPSRQTSQKIAPNLLPAAANSSSGAYRVRVKDEAAFRKWLQEQKLELTVKNIRGHEQTLLLTGLQAQHLGLLLQCPWVKYIDRSNRAAHEELELKDADFRANNIPAVHSLFPSLNGAGLVASVKEEPFNPDDLDLRGRVLSPQNLGGAYSTHATTMATIIAGAGNTGPDGKGIADHAQLSFSSFAELFPDQAQDLLAKGVSVQNHSYGVGVENYYGLEANAYDQQTYQHPQLLHVFSSGNSGDKTDISGTYANISGFANLTGQFKNSKNTLCVGALEPTGLVGTMSSRGPAYDGRVKPELVAFGKGGTSEAAAVASGAALLVQQAYQQQHSGTLPPAALVKAALINSAEDAGRPEVDFETGFGNADALGAVRSIAEGRFFAHEVTQGQEQVFTITVPAGAHQLKATLVWHDPEAEPDATQALLNDLDLSLQFSATGVSWQPWVLNAYPHPDSLRLPAKRGTDRVNNVEQITVHSPAAGTYQLKVKGHSIPQGPQQFSLVYEYEEGAEWLFPVSGATLEAGVTSRIRWRSGQWPTAARLEYRLGASSEWLLIDAAVDMAEASYNWQAPALASHVQLRLVTDKGSMESGEFIVSPKLAPQVGIACEDRAMIFWPKLEGVQQYQVYQLGATYLEPLVTVTDTFAILKKSATEDLSSFIAVAPLVESTKASNSKTIAYDRQGIDCYFRSFLPRQLIMDTVTLDLELSSTYQLTSLSLERLDKGAFKPVQVVSSVSGLRHYLRDPTPKPGKNVYRAKVTADDGSSYYSSTEEVVYAPADFIQAYPNPVAAGERLFVAVSSGSAKLQLYNQVGTLLYESEEDGVLKQLETAGLYRGLYILRLVTEQGSFLTTRVLIQ